MNWRELIAFTSVGEIQILRIDEEQIAVRVERAVHLFGGKFRQFLRWSDFLIYNSVFK